MKIRFVLSSALTLTLSLGVIAQAKGRRPGEEPFDDSRVSRGSPANPTSAFQPPRFDAQDTPPAGPEEDADEFQPVKKTPSAAPKNEPSPTEENWTVSGGRAQATAPASTPGTKNAPSSKPAAAAPPAADGIYEPPLPDEPQPDPLAPAKKK